LTAKDLSLTRAGDSGPRLLFIDPYLTMSHRALRDGLLAHVPARWTALTLPGRYFRWRMRGAASYLALTAREILRQPWDGLVCSSMLGLAELKGLAPELSCVPALAYFHENQLAYPAPGAADARQQERDLFLAFTDLSTAQAARLVAFNSGYHRREFLGAAGQLIVRLPDARPTGLVQAIAAKSLVLPPPLETGPAEGLARDAREGPLRLVWNHRWEHDKDPEGFFRALDELAKQGLAFEVAVLGVASGRRPEVFGLAGALLGPRLKHLGPVAERREYWRWLFWADLAVSTACQEYFGLAVAEAVWAGCRPLLPSALVYPELYPERFLYQPGALAAALRPLVERPELARGEDTRPLAQAHTWEALAPAWTEALARLTA
jgi:glycosyltransferase involved in cell wall biosynthesis